MHAHKHNTHTQVGMTLLVYLIIMAFSVVAPLMPVLGLGYTAASWCVCPPPAWVQLTPMAGSRMLQPRLQCRPIWFQAWRKGAWKRQAGQAHAHVHACKGAFTLGSVPFNAAFPFREMDGQECFKHVRECSTKRPLAPLSPRTEENDMLLPHCMAG